MCRFMARLLMSLAEHRCLFHLAQPPSCLHSRASKSQLSWQSRDGVTSGHGEWERGAAQLLPDHSRASALTARISIRSTLRSIYFFPLVLPSTSFCIFIFILDSLPFFMIFTATLMLSQGGHLRRLTSLRPLVFSSS